MAQKTRSTLGGYFNFGGTGLASPEVELVVKRNELVHQGIRVR